MDVEWFKLGWGVALEEDNEAPENLNFTYNKELVTANNLLNFGVFRGGPIEIIDTRLTIRQSGIESGNCYCVLYKSEESSQAYHMNRILSDGINIHIPAKETLGAWLIGKYDTNTERPDRRILLESGDTLYLCFGSDKPLYLWVMMEFGVRRT